MTPQATVGAEVWPLCGLHFHSDSLCHRHHNQTTKAQNLKVVQNKKRLPSFNAQFHINIPIKVYSIKKYYTLYQALKHHFRSCQLYCLFVSEIAVTNKNNKVMEDFHQRRSSFLNFSWLSQVVRTKLNETRQYEECMKKNLVICFSAASFPPIKRHSEGKQFAGEEMLQQFLNRKQCLLLTKETEAQAKQQRILGLKATGQQEKLHKRNSSQKKREAKYPYLNTQMSFKKPLQCTEIGQNEHNTCLM